MVLVGAPYVVDMLKTMRIKRFELFSELGVDDLPRQQNYRSCFSRTSLLHVGRTVRTKGLRDVIRALARLRDMSGLTLDVAGDGPDLPVCEREASRLGIADRVQFHGRLDPDGVRRLYERSEIFVFPSFREPSGGVIIEAMSYGLPVITVARGGPDYLVDDTCGVKVDAVTPDQLAADLARVIGHLAANPALRRSLGEGARRRVHRIALWPSKIEQLMSYYNDVAEMFSTSRSRPNAIES
jgi:glycosyltransferase involved in cell wall biosynthesis